MKEISQKENEKNRFLVSCGHCNGWHKWNLQKNNNQTNLSAITSGRLLQIIDIFHPERKKERKDNKKKRSVWENVFSGRTHWLVHHGCFLCESWSLDRLRHSIFVTCVPGFLRTFSYIFFCRFYVLVLGTRFTSRIYCTWLIQPEDDWINSIKHHY